MESKRSKRFGKEEYNGKLCALILLVSVILQEHNSLRETEKEIKRGSDEEIKK
jgi:hypothetical protein